MLPSSRSGRSSTVATAVSLPSDSGGRTKVSPIASFRSDSPTWMGSRHELFLQAHDLGARVALWGLPATITPQLPGGDVVGQGKPQDVDALLPRRRVVDPHQYLNSPI